MTRSLKNALVVGGVLALTLLYAIYRKQQVTQLFHGEDTLAVKRLPEVELATLARGEKLLTKTIHSDQSELLVVHFWATWCPPCLGEFPELLQLARIFAHNPRIKFLAVAVRDQRQEVVKWVKKFGQIPKNFHLTLDPQGQAMSSFGTVKVPETHIYFKRRSVKRLIGPQRWQNTYFAHDLRQLLGKPGDAP